MGKPTHWKSACLLSVGIGEREPCEVKHLSSTWKINQLRRKAQRDSVSSGERKRKCNLVYKVIKFIKFLKFLQKCNYFITLNFMNFMN